MKKEYTLTLEELNAEIPDILNILQPYKVWILHGEMGSGKTTLVRSIARALGSEEEASSPTYTLINEYKFSSNPYHLYKILHLDLFRIKNLEEAYGIGIEEILEAETKCIIEWPEIILPLLQDESVISIFIHHVGEGKRKYILTTDRQ